VVGRLNPSVIPVVCAIISDRAGNILLAQRPEHKHLGLLWEFPGGKIERGESPENALIREIREELGCDITIGRALSRFQHDYGSVVIEMFPFVCSLTANSTPAQAHEHKALAWVLPNALSSYDLAPADWPIVRELSVSNPIG
jgi:8-oxo-dGTP diphosphatase